jgi:hypothetical protein
MAQLIVECLTRFGIEDQVCLYLYIFNCLTYWIKVFSICMDNASNCDKLAVVLGDKLPSFEGANARIRCFAHILNLIAKVSYLILFYLNSC